MKIVKWCYIILTCIHAAVGGGGGGGGGEVSGFLICKNKMILLYRTSKSFEQSLEKSCQKSGGKRLGEFS